MVKVYFKRFKCSGRIMQSAKITELKIGKYGFLTSNLAKEPYILNMNMPIFKTKKEAQNWIENSNEWE